MHHINGPSSLGRRYACPASAEMERLHGIDRQSAAAETGEDLHDVVASILSPYRTSREAEDAEEQEAVLCCVSFAEGLSKDCTIRPRIEQQVVCRHKGTDLFYGTADFIVFQQDRIFVVDWKFYKVMPDPIDLTWQLTAYAVAAAQCYGFRKATGIAFMPYLADYLSWELDGALDDNLMAIQHVIDNTERENPPLQPGSHCRWCKAIHACPAVTTGLDELAKDLAPIKKVEKKREVKEHAERLLAEMDAAQIERLAGMLPYLEPAIEALRHRIREILRQSGVGKHNMSTLPYRLRHSDRRRVSNVLGIWEEMSDKLTPSDFIDCCTLSLPKLKRKWLAACPEMSPAEAKARFDYKVDQHCSYFSVESLVPVKEKKDVGRKQLEPGSEDSAETRSQSGIADPPVEG